MPYTRSKNKIQKPKRRKMKECIARKKQMKTRLMVISLKADDYIYKKKPISTHEAYMYARELEAFGKQCRDERYLQVIEKLTSYMKWIISEQSPTDIININMADPTENSIEENPIEELNIENELQNAAGPINNAIVDIEMEKSLSKLSIVDIKDPLDITDKNDNECYQKNTKVENSTSTTTKKNLNGNNINKENNKYKSNVGQLKPKTFRNQKENIVEQSQNILRNSVKENYIKSGTLRNYRNIKNKQIQEILEGTTHQVTEYDSTNVRNKSDISNLNVTHQKEKEVDDSELSQNLLSNFTPGNLSATLQNKKNPMNNQVYRGSEIASSITDPRNIVKNFSNINIKNTNIELEEVSNINVIEEKNGDNKKLSQNLLSNFEYKNYATILQNNANTMNYKPCRGNEPANIIADPIHIVNNYSNMTTGNKSTKLGELSNINVTEEKEKGGNSKKLSQNILSNFEYKNYTGIGIFPNSTNSKNYQSQQNIETHYTTKDDTFSKCSQIQNNLIRPNLAAFKPTHNIQHNIIKTPESIQQNNLTHNPTQNQTHVIETVNKRKNPVKKDIAKTAKKRTNKRKNKINDVDVTLPRKDLNNEKTVDSYFLGAKNPEHSVNNSSQKNKRMFLKKKREIVDMSWVENMKFVRVIEREEFINVDEFEKSFWTDFTLPSNITLTDFEYDDINIWKN